MGIGGIMRTCVVVRGGQAAGIGGGSPCFDAIVAHTQAEGVGVHDLSEGCKHDQLHTLLKNANV